jgi:nicotinamidase/pyrazinamidase
MKTLIMVDVQNDFCPGGALAVREGDAIVPVINALASRFDLVVATQDWHPANHRSFASQWNKTPGEIVELNGLAQVLWPDHCVQNTRGAEFHPALETARITRVFRKGEDPNVDSYSGFYDNGHQRTTGLGDWLQEQGANAVWICGLATDYCVKWTALDARNLGLETHLIADACRGVELQSGDCDRAVAEMREAGVQITNSVDL